MKHLFLCLLLGAVVTGARAQLFDYEDIKSGKFTQKSVSGLRSMADGEHYSVVEEGAIVRYAYKTGAREEVLFDSKTHQESLPEGFSEYVLSADERRILLTSNRKPIYRRSYTADHWIYDRTTGTLMRLTPEGGEQVPAFSPDGTRVAFVRNNDLWMVTLSDGVLTRLTSDGERNRIINGHTDWVYEEEFAFTRAFEWSPDGRKIAFLRFDESRVPEYTIMRFEQHLYPQPYTYKYPKAGEPNSTVELHVCDVTSGTLSKVDVGPETDQYLPRIGWTPEGELYFYRTNRRQNHFELLLVENGAQPRVVYDERDPRYVERVDEQTVTFLSGDRFLVKNETSGNMHLYLFDVDKGVQDTLTRGNWDVTQLVAVSGDRVYYISDEGSALRRNLFSVKLNGKSKKRLTEEEGTFSIAPSRGFKYFISYFSNVLTPNLVRLHDASGKVLRTLEDNAELKRRLEERRVPHKEFFRFTNDYGNTLNGYMIKPYNFDPSKQYPVMMTQYSGPGSQEVLDKWSMDWTDVLVQDGYIVVCVDGRGTGCRGAEFKKCTYGNLGARETEDQIAAAKYISTLSYVDSDRIGIYGWSYGGFMALNCILKGADVFKMAIAVAPVTSWRFYDSIYTEIYNGLPQDNAKGYDDNSPIHFADRLKGRLLIIHGTGDDNVHVQNTYRMADALIRAGKQFDMAIYPDDNHSMVPTGRHHIRERMIEYTLRNL